MNAVRYHYELDAAALDYIMKLLGTRPHDEVRGLYDHFLRGRMQQDKERENEMKLAEEQQNRQSIGGALPGGIAQTNGQGVPAGE